MGNGIWKLSRNDDVNLDSIVDLVPLTQEYEDVPMREIMLLELVGVNQACYFTKETALTSFRNTSNFWLKTRATILG